MTRAAHPFTVVQIAPLPPPYGGVSVHVRRLASALTAAGLKVVLFAQEGSDPVPGAELVQLEANTWRGWVRAGGLRLRPQVVHCHRGWRWSKGLLLATLYGARVVVTVHSEHTMDTLAIVSWKDRLAARLLMGSPRVHWIAVSDRLRDRLLEFGVRASNVTVAHAYLPLDLADAGSPALPDGLRAFASAHHPLLTVYGWRDNVMPDGAGWYGFDLAIEAVDLLRATWPACGLVILVPSAEPAERLDAMRADVRERGMEANVCIWTDPLADPSALWTSTDVYLRPTRTDGDAVSVREVLALGGAVVASDCCGRPDGVRVFPSGDVGALTDAIIEELSSAKESTPLRATADALDSILKAYGLATAGTGSARA